MLGEKGVYYSRAKRGGRQRHRKWVVAKEQDGYSMRGMANIDSQRCIRSRGGLNRAGKPAACTTNGFETLRDAEWSAIKRVKRANLSLLARSQGPVECESLPRSGISYTRRLLPPPSMMNEPSSKVESSSSSPAVPGMFVGRPHYKNCYRHLARPPPPSLGVSPNMMNRLIDQHSCKDCNAIYLPSPFLCISPLPPRPTPSSDID
jgi:hypothetical protein